MTTIALDCELLSQLRHSAGDGFSWDRKSKAVLVGDALAEVKERMGTMAAAGSPAPESAKEAASAAFQSLVRDVPQDERASVGGQRAAVRSEHRRSKLRRDKQI